MDFLIRLEESGFGTWVRESPSLWAYPTVLFLHTLGLALLLPAASFLLIGAIAPLRRSGRPAAFVSIAAVAASLAAAIKNWTIVSAATAPIHANWNWLPGANGPLATMGVLVDHQSSLMLILVTLVATLVQIYSLEYLHDEPPAAFGRYYAYHSLFVFSMKIGRAHV